MHLLVQPVSFGHKKRCVVASFLWKGIILHNCEFMYLFFDKSKNVPNGGNLTHCSDTYFLCNYGIKPHAVNICYEIKLVATYFDILLKIINLH